MAAVFGVLDTTLRARIVVLTMIDQSCNTTLTKRVDLPSEGTKRDLIPGGNQLRALRGREFID